MVREDGRDHGDDLETSSACQVAGLDGEASEEAIERSR